MFEHSHLPNVGLTEGKIPPEIYQSLNKEIVDIHTNDKDIGEKIGSMPPYETSLKKNKKKTMCV